MPSSVAPTQRLGWHVLTLRPGQVPSTRPTRPRKASSGSSVGLGTHGVWFVVRPLVVPHVTSDRGVHLLPRSQASVVCRAPTGCVCPPSAVILLAAHSFSLLSRSSGAWGISPHGVLAGHLVQVRSSLSGKNRPEQCKIQLARGRAGIRVDCVESAAGWCAHCVYPSVRLSVSLVRPGHPRVGLSVCLCPVLVRLSVFRAIPDMRTQSGRSLDRSLSVSFLFFTWHDARNGQSDS